MRTTLKERVLPAYTRGEEIFNMVTHIVGGAIGIGAVLACVITAALRGNVWGIVSGSIYGASVIILYTMSSIYHGLTAPLAKKVFQIFDHCTIFIMIAGTYTPISLLGIGGAQGWVYFGIEWAMAILGVILYSLKRTAMRRVEIAIYIIMGWAIIIGFRRLWDNVPRLSSFLLLGGGAIYTLGTLWYRRRHRRLSHVIWHVHVIGGAACHWLSLWLMS